MYKCDDNTTDEIIIVYTNLYKLYIILIVVFGISSFISTGYVINGYDDYRLKKINYHLEMVGDNYVYNDYIICNIDLSGYELERVIRKFIKSPNRFEKTLEYKRRSKLDKIK
jgi:hypothetical protein